MIDIFLVGKAGSGKDTAGQILVKEFGYKRIAIADDIKNLSHWLFKQNQSSPDKIVFQISKKLNIMPDKAFTENIFQLINDLNKVNPNKNAEMRKIYQDLGQIARQVNPNIWLLLVKEKIEKARDPIVITDGRLRSEQIFFENIGFKTYEIIADIDKRISRLKTRDPGFKPESLNHSTEKEIFNCPQIHNNKNIDHLREKIISILGDKK